MSELGLKGGATANTMQTGDAKQDRQVSGGSPFQQIRADQTRYNLPMLTRITRADRKRVLQLLTRE